MGIREDILCREHTCPIFAKREKEPYPILKKGKENRCVVISLYGDNWWTLSYGWWTDPQVQGKASRDCIVLYHCVRSKGRRQFGGNRKIRKPLAAERSGRDAMTNKDYPDPEKRFMYLWFAPPFFLDKSAEIEKRGVGQNERDGKKHIGADSYSGQSRIIQRKHS